MPITLWNFNEIFLRLGTRGTVDDPGPMASGGGFGSLLSKRLIHMLRIPRSGGK